MDDAASRFRDKYILTVAYNVPECVRRCYIRQVWQFIRAHPERRLSAVMAEDVESYLQMKGRSEQAHAGFRIMSCRNGREEASSG